MQKCRNIKGFQSPSSSGRSIERLVPGQTSLPAIFCFWKPALGTIDLLAAAQTSYAAHKKDYRYRPRNYGRLATKSCRNIIKLPDVKIAYTLSNYRIYVYFLRGFGDTMGTFHFLGTFWGQNGDFCINPLGVILTYFSL